MRIVRAEMSDLVEILYLVKECVTDMNARGLKYWNTFYPGSEIIIRDLQSRSIFLIKDNEVCKGMITLDKDAPGNYKNMEWHSGSEKVLYVHRMAVHPKWKDAGIVEMLIGQAEQYARDNEFTSIRLDTFSKDSFSSDMITAHNFKKAGEFLTEYQKTPFYCYEKEI